MRKASQIAAMLALAHVSLADSPALERIAETPESRPARSPRNPHQGVKERARRVKQKKEQP